MTAARLGSGVRARWVELPDCGAGPQDATKGQYALNDDLSNAIIATCKVERPAGWVAPNATYAFGDSVGDLNKLGLGPDANKGATPKTYIDPAIYDPVVHVDYLIPTQEHQVTQQQNGTVEATTEIPDDPAGDWYMGGKQNAGDEWKAAAGGGLVKIANLAGAK